MLDRTKFELINLITEESHGLFDSELDARRIAHIDGVTVYEIVRGYERAGEFHMTDRVARVDRNQVARRRIGDGEFQRRPSHAGC